jgi:hypothetical protein
LDRSDGSLERRRSPRLFWAPCDVCWSMHNLVEPECLVRHFIAHPPREVFARVGEHGAPLFSMRFDLLTSADAATRARLERLPLFRKWRRWLRLSTCFVGTTVSEYVLAPADLPASAFAERVLCAHGPHHRLVIIKDIPTQSPLLPPAANRYADELVEACRERGCAVLAGQALAYVPIDFASVDQYLQRLSAARRKDLRRKLRSRAILDIEIVPTGSAPLADPQTLADLYALYLNVYQQSTAHFDLLTPEFFVALFGDASARGVVFLYRRAGEMIGFNLCFVHGDMLVDKYIGFRYPEAHDSHLYFVSWFQNLEYALAHGLSFYVAGWTDPEIKRALGARFTWTRHAVYARNPLLRAVLRRAGRHFESDRTWHRNINDGTARHS